MPGFNGAPIVVTLHSSRLVAFPALSRHNHRVTSPETPNYNCVAYVAGDTTRWWWPDNNNYWPPGITRDPADTQSFVEAFAALGYSICTDGALEAGFQRIVIFVHPDGQPTHAALQLETGKWSSKLGRCEDIEHDSEHDVEGSCNYCYGYARIYMRRIRATQEAT